MGFQALPLACETKVNVESTPMRMAARFQSLFPVLANVLLAGLPLSMAGNAAEGSNTAISMTYSLRWSLDPADTNRFRVEVTGLSRALVQQLERADWNVAQWQQVLAAYADQGDLIADMGLPPMLGAYRVASNSVRFDPQFPLEPGVTYRAIFHPDRLPEHRGKGSSPIMAVFKAPSRPVNPTTVVTHVYPSGDVLPENLLKFYLHFSAPMKHCPGMSFWQHGESMV